MRILAIHVGKPQEFHWEGKKVTTGIFKSPVNQPVWIRRHNLEGDEQADLKVHGGEHKAVYSYSSEFYPWWKKELAREDLPFGIFGENLTTECVDEKKCYVGDHYQIGTAVLEAAQPRQPCFKLALRFNDPSILKKFLASGRFGIYYRVVQEGIVQPGDGMKKIFEHPAQIPTNEVFELIQSKTPDTEKLQTLLSIPTLCPRIQAKVRSCMKP